ncbi:MAG TPA: enoyl-CoA hydratase-related protein [Roseiarcus sp.]|nr:enoyl-CoA hydratase-related protein [Roseiarcus sp.]
MSSGIDVSREGAVLSAAFDRAEKKNAITSAMYEALIDVFEKAEADPSVGAVLLSGKGGAFTAGNDVADFLAIATGAAGSRDVRDFPGWRFISKLAEFEKPLVAAVQGTAIGIGTTLCFHCDLVYAAPDARFQMPFVDLGLVPEAGSSLLAPQRFGRVKAAEFLLLGEAFDAESAHTLGLVNEVVPGERLPEHAMRKAQELAAKPRSALLAARKLLRGDSATLKQRMTEEIQAFSAALSSEDARKAFQTFLSGKR